MSSSGSPTAYVIAGPNGAGKTKFATDFLPEFVFWLPSAEMAVARVAGRVRQGGHGGPEATISRRFRAGLCNFFQLYAPLVNSWYLYNRSELPPRSIADCIEGVVRVHQAELYEVIQTDRED
jgi:predicted ABC-type ATPase